MACLFLWSFAYFRVVVFLRADETPGISASVQDLVICRAFFAASRLTAEVAGARAEPAILLAPLRNMLINGFFMATVCLEKVILSLMHCNIPGCDDSASGRVGQY